MRLSSTIASNTIGSASNHSCPIERCSTLEQVGSKMEKRETLKSLSQFFNYTPRLQNVRFTVVGFFAPTRSGRVHSIFVLRLFNDGVAMWLLFAGVYLFLLNRCLPELAL